MHESLVEIRWMLVALIVLFAIFLVIQAVMARRRGWRPPHPRPSPLWIPRAGAGIAIVAGWETFRWLLAFGAWKMATPPPSPGPEVQHLLIWVALGLPGAFVWLARGDRPATDRAGAEG